MEPHVEVLAQKLKRSIEIARKTAHRFDDSDRCVPVVVPKHDLRDAQSLVHTKWLSPPSRLVLKDDEVHVWRASLELKPKDVQNLLKTLSADETQRANRFHFDKDRSHFIVARGLVRKILSQYLRTDPHSLRFSYNLNGKPTLVAVSNGSSFSFNLSHADDLMLLAVTHGRQIGIDLDRLDGSGRDEILERIFSQEEIAKLGSLSGSEREAAFSKYWTKVEAVVKAKGEALASTLDQVEVSISNGRKPATFMNNATSQPDSGWSITEIDPGPGYVAALAVLGSAFRMKFWQWLEKNEGLQKALIFMTLAQTIAG
jgi:4'-phosphopantetheinyl transferase